MKVAPTWILVADGGQAFVIEHKNAAAPLQRISNIESTDRRKRRHDIRKGEPGRVVHGAKSTQRPAAGDNKWPAREAEEKFRATHAADTRRA